MLQFTHAQFLVLVGDQAGADEVAFRDVVEAAGVGGVGPAAPVLEAVKLVTGGRRRLEVAVEALLGSLDHKCTYTLVHLAPGGQVCLGYR
jgi:hypothetical protein